ncbi:hypothetical protein ACV357_31835, partial [Pseudomonas aeruginosa]
RSRPRTSSAPVSGSQGFEQAPQARKVQASSAGGDSLPVSARDLLAFQRPVSSHAAMALASYNSTASLNIDAGAEAARSAPRPRAARRDTA